MVGWIKLHRDLLNHHIWKDKPFTKGQAWIDLILLANHEDTRFVLGNQIIEAKRGDVITSEVKLMERWGWSKSKVRAFLNLLQAEEMIVKKTDRKKTTLTLTNYCFWQDSQTMNEPQKDRKKTAKRPQKDTIKNDKNDKNIYTTTREKLSTVSTGGAIRAIEKEFGRPLSPIELEQIGKWAETYPAEIITEALRIMILRGVYNLAYMDRILLGWEKQNLKTIQQVREHEEKRQKSRDKPKPKAEWNVKNLDDLYEL